jgi:uncharacterized phage protein (TIGR01671 family)
VRELKFRIWDYEKMTTPAIEIYGNTTKSSMWSVVQHGYGEASSERIIMQYTGVKDKDDKEIYEGDIVQYGTEDDIVTAIIEFQEQDDEESMFISGFRLVVISNTEYQDNDEEDYALKVIGNIYQNPELL